MNEFTRKAIELVDSYAMWLYQYTTFGTPDKRERFEAARSALLAHLEGGEQKWLPIETAPVGKPIMMLWRPIDHAERPHFQHSIVVGSLEYGDDYRPNGIAWANGMKYDIATHITGWQALPAAPTEESP